MDAETALSQFPALSSVSPDSRAAILRESKVHQFPAGAVLQRKGEVCPGLPMVVAGEIQVRAVGENGRSMHLYSIGRGETCVLSAGCLLSGKAFSAEAITSEPTAALVIPAPLLAKLFVSEPAVRDLVFTSFSDRLGDLLEVVEDVAFAQLDRRIATWLAGAGAVALTHEEIAARFGSARQVVSRLLGEWQKKGWIRQERGKIEVLDAKQLGNLGDRPAAPDR